MNECECMNVRMYFAFIPKYTTDFMKELSAIRNINRQVFALSNVVKFGFSEKATKFEKNFVVLLTRALCSVGATVYLSKSWRRFLKLMWTSIIQTLQFQMTFFYFRSLCTNRIDHASYEKEKKNVGLKRSWFLSLWFQKVIWNFFYWSIQ